jgi:hypothetical protein
MVGMRFADVFVVKVLIHPRLAIAKDGDSEEFPGLDGHFET